MLNETMHLKVSLCSLPVPATHKPSHWIDWHLGRIEEDFVTFAHVVDQHGSGRWEMVDSTFRYRCKDMLYGFKSGAVYEAEIGQRTVHGRLVNAEAYLDHLARLSSVPINHIPFAIKATVRVDLSLSVHRTHEHEWDHSQTHIAQEGDQWRVELMLDNALSVVFVHEAPGEAVLELLPIASTATTQVTLPHNAGETLELFA